MDYVLNESKILNYVMVGTTGSGKSSTCNFLAQRKAFHVSDGVASCTASCQDIDIEIPMLLPHKVRLIDTVGFGDSKMSEENVFTILREFAGKIVDFGSTCQIDAFLLVVGAYPRLATLKDDIERLVNLFGTEVLKSTFILVIDAFNKGLNDASMLQFMNSADMAEVKERIVEYKGTKDIDQNCFMIWDNFNPNPTQLETLVTRIQTLPPYTHIQFTKAKEEMKQKYDRLQATIEAKLKRIYQGDIDKLNEKMQIERKKLEERFNLEKAQREKAEEMFKMVEASMQSQMATMSANYEKDLAAREKIQQDQRESHEKQMALLKTVISSNDAANRQQLEAMMKQNADISKQLIAIANRPPQVIHVPSGGGGRGCFDCESVVFRQNRENEVENVTLKEVKVGDYILSLKKGATIERNEFFFEKVILVTPLPTDTKPQEYVEIIAISHDGQEISLKLRDTHFMHVLRDSQWIHIESQQVLPNDQIIYTDPIYKRLQLLSVAQVGKCTVTGVMNIKTVSGSYFVNGLYCSSTVTGDYGPLGHFVVQMAALIHPLLPNAILSLRDYLKHKT